MNDAHEEPTAAFVPVWDDEPADPPAAAPAVDEAAGTAPAPDVDPPPWRFGEDAVEAPAPGVVPPEVTDAPEAQPPAEATRPPEVTVLPLEVPLEVAETSPFEAAPFTPPVTPQFTPPITPPPAAPPVPPPVTLPPAAAPARAPVTLPPAPPPTPRPDPVTPRATTGSGTLRSTVSEPVGTSRATVKRPSRALVRVRSVVTLVVVVLFSGVALAAAIGVVLAAIGLLLRRAAGG